MIFIIMVFYTSMAFVFATRDFVTLLQVLKNFNMSICWMI